MATISRTMTVNPPPETVLAYLKDFSHAEEWDPGTVSCTRIDDGEIRVGSQWHNESKIFGVSTELTYELIELTGTKVVLRGTNKSATSTDSITVRGAGSGSEVTYSAEITMKGAGRFADPLMKVVFEKVGNDVVKDLTGALNKLA